MRGGKVCVWGEGGRGGEGGKGMGDGEGSVRGR